MPPVRSDSGFTLIEVLVAIVILLVGVLGVVAMVDGANAVTSKTKAREGANNVARSIVEVGRAVPYRDLTSESMFAALDARPALADVGEPGYRISARGIDYTVTLQICAMDDPKDDLGPHDTGTPFCPESDVGSALGTYDRNPDDYRRIAVTLTWQRGGGTETVKQTSLVSNPIGGLGPNVIRLDAPNVTTTPKLITAGTSVDFQADTSTNAAQLDWSVDGVVQGQGSSIGGSERSFDFTWNFDGTTGAEYFDDCTYVIQAQAFDEQGRAGSPKALTVVLNRAEPRAPVEFEGGRNGHETFVDLVWKRSPECDVLGYRVYRSTTGATGPWERVDCGEGAADYTEAVECLDDHPDTASDPLWYRVVAVDTVGSTATFREGVASVIRMSGQSAVPSAPTNLSACEGGTEGCTEPDGSPASDDATVIRWAPSTDPDPGDSILMYRIYRDGTTYADRYAVFFPEAGNALAWTDPNTPDGTAHTYYVSAVDLTFGESALSDAVVGSP